MQKLLSLPLLSSKSPPEEMISLTKAGVKEFRLRGRTLLALIIVKRGNHDVHFKQLVFVAVPEN